MDVEGETIGDSDVSIVEHLSSSEVPNEIQNPNHIHPLLLGNWQGYAYDDHCLICEVEISEHNHYGCETCQFYLCKLCVRKPLIINPKRSHEHPLSLVPNLSLVFTCLACGVNRNGYNCSSILCLCIQCCFIIHWQCVSLPRVICINRHDHRISHVSSLDSEENQICKVCRKTVDWRYGSYSCSTCLNYVVHSLCATSLSVWDGVELEGVPEEDPEDILPFKVIGEGVIKYFSHDHNLRLITIDKEKDDNGNQTYYIQCNACVGHIYSDPYYRCTHDECSFVLHEACANLLQKKRHPSHAHRLTLMTKVKYWRTFPSCDCCKQAISGFAYEGRSFYIDVRCASILDGFIHRSHPHPLYYDEECRKCCSGCKKWTMIMMKSEECSEGFALCFRCATLPYEVKLKYDSHVLSLCYGEEDPVLGVYWCEICEKRLDPSNWFYTCGECCSTLHIYCVLGEDPYIRFGSYSDEYEGSFEVVLNNSVTFQPNCYMCPSRCKTIYSYEEEARNKPPFLFHGLNVFTTQNLFFCSYLCLQRNSDRTRI